MPDILSVECDLTAGHIVKARYQVAQRRLPAAGGSHNGKFLPRMDLQVEICKHLVVVVRVLKADVVKLDLTLRRDEIHRALLVKDLDIRVHDLQETLDPRDPALELLGKLYDPADRRDQCGHIHDVGNHVTRKDLPVHQEKSAADNDGEIHQTVKDPRRSAEHSHQHVRVLFHPQKLLVALLEFRRLKRLVCERLDNLLPEQAVLDLCIQLTDLVALFAECPAHLLVDDAADDRHDRHEHKDHQRQWQIDLRQNDERYHDLDRRDEKLLRAVVRKLRHLEQVIRDAPHDLADLRVVEIRV